MKPDECIGIEQNHLRGRPPLNSNPAPVHSHVHCPAATSGSINSIIFCRPPRRRLSSGRITNRTPRRSMTAGWPCSAASRRSENRARASATEYRFICPLYIGGAWRAVTPPRNLALAVHRHVRRPMMIGLQTKELPARGRSYKLYVGLIQFPRPSRVGRRQLVDLLPPRPPGPIARCRSVRIASINRVRQPRPAFNGEVPLHESIVLRSCRLSFFDK